MKKVLIDSDIILDLFSQREPFYKSAAELFSLIDNGSIKGYVSSLIFSNLFYILKKLKSKSQARNILIKLKVLTEVLPVDEKIIELALASNLDDFEDAIQYYVAINKKIDVIITRNIKDYKNADIHAITAEDYLKLFF